jgi:hypothetical protein
MRPGNRPVGFDIGADVDLVWHAQLAACILPVAPRQGTPLTDNLFAPWLLVAAATMNFAAAQESAAATTTRLREIRIVTADVFTDDDPRPLTHLITALHWQTRADVVAREMWFGRGDVVDAESAAELERNLRALDLFADVSVRLVATEQPDLVDIEITTRDRLTLNVGAGASYVGGVTGVRAVLGESNLFGLGDRANFAFAENSEGEYRGAFAYTDLHLFDSWHTGTLRLSRTDEGDSLGLEVRRPFKHLTDPRSHAASFVHDETAADYYRGGESVAEVPYTRDALTGELSWAAGSRVARSTFGLRLTAEHFDYDTARGPLAPAIRVPGDTWNVSFGPELGWQWIDGYREVEGLDTLVYVQDLTLGSSLGAGIGARWRDEDGLGGDLQPEAGVRAAHAMEPWTHVFTNMNGSAGVRLDNGDAVGWFATASARAFALATDAHTFAASVTFDAVEESQDLARELTLGEDSGLRGYRARLFSGTRRVRGNLEHRFDTGIEFATLHFGTVLFGDAGYIGEGSDLGEPLTSAGFGLRIGSKPLLGDTVVRFDFAKPLDDVPGESDAWQISLTVGQVFTFGGNVAGLGGG